MASSSGAEIIPSFDFEADPNATQFDLLLTRRRRDGRDEGVVMKHHALGGLVMPVCTGAGVPVSF